MIPPPFLLSKIFIGQAEVKESVKAIGDSPVEYFYNTITTRPDTFQGCLAQMLKYLEEHREELKAVLKECKVVFPTELPGTIPPNHGLSDEM